jgi:hypothetical protein
MRTSRRALLLLVITFLLVSGLLAAIALSPASGVGVRYFDETDTTLREPFLTYFEQNGGLEGLGLPLADAYTLDDSTTVQPFQHVLLQVTVRGVEPAPIAVSLGLGQPTDAPVDERLAGYYASGGGAAFFGLPLGEGRFEGQTFVQDFENARIVQQPDGTLQLANLGEAYVSVYPPPANYGQANIRLRGTPSPPPAIAANVSVASPTLGLGEQQTIYVVVSDEEGKPVGGVQALAILRFDGAEAEVELPPTDANGLTQATFGAPPATPGSQVIVEMNLLYGDTFFTVQTTYVQWW